VPVKPNFVQNYHARMQRVLDHIDAHPDGDLGVAALSGVAAFSRCHFHRQFAALYGVGVYRYVQLMRLKRASYQLAYRDDAILRIALDNGYESPEAFARAFRQQTDQSPSGFRREPQWESWHAALAPLHQPRSFQMQQFSDDQVHILDFPDTPVAILEHRGDPAHVGDSIRRFIAWRKANNLVPANSATFNILHGDLEDSPPEDYRFDLCAATRRTVEPNGAGVMAGLIPGGRCAVLRLTGSSDHLRAAVMFLYGQWLPKSGHELRDFPVFAQRVRFFPDVPEHAAVTDIFLPLA
jgi:AraC family transcriptional regulator